MKIILDFEMNIPNPNDNFKSTNNKATKIGADLTSNLTPSGRIRGAAWYFIELKDVRLGKNQGENINFFEWQDKNGKQQKCCLYTHTYL